MDYFKTLIIIVLIIIILYFIISKIVFYNKSEYLKSNTNDKYYLVKDTKNKYNKVELIDKLFNSLNVLLEELKNSNYDFKDINIEEIQEKIKNSEILENITDSDTSYTVNKGEKIILCLADRENDNLYSYNLLMYVLIHELAHILNTTYGHDDNFKKTFRFILEKAIELNLYTYEDYKNNPVNYCGLILNTNIMD